jgi:molybdate transport system regulatory protein
MKVSARNVFFGTVVACTSGDINTEVVIALPGGERLVAIVTLASARELGLAAGSEVFALVKAPWVTVLAGAGAVPLSARNLLTGRVSAVEGGAVNAAVSIELADGGVVSAVVTRAAVAELGLRPGVEAVAVINASDIVLGVPGGM